MGGTDKGAEGEGNKSKLGRRAPCATTCTPRRLGTVRPRLGARRLGARLRPPVFARLPAKKSVSDGRTIMEVHEPQEEFSPGSWSSTDANHARFRLSNASAEYQEQIMKRADEQRRMRDMWRQQIEEKNGRAKEQGRGQTHGGGRQGGGGGGGGQAGPPPPGGQWRDWTAAPPAVSGYDDGRPPPVSMPVPPPLATGDHATTRRCQYRLRLNGRATRCGCGVRHVTQRGARGAWMK